MMVEVAIYVLVVKYETGVHDQTSGECELVCGLPQWKISLWQP